MKKQFVLILIAAMFGLTACSGGKASEEASQETEEFQEAAVTEEVSEDISENTSEEFVESTEEKHDYVEDTVLSAELLTITMPDEFNGKYLAEIDGNKISFYDKESNEAGFGGFVFSVVVDKDNEIMAGGMYTKVGELSTPNGDLYNVCKGYPSEVQWDYNKYSEIEDAKDYYKLHEAADDIISYAKANEGCTFIYGAGTKGEELYGNIVSKYIDALSEEWDANKFEEEGMSPEFYVIKQENGEKASEKIGFAYRDITNDGVDELLMGPISDTAGPSVVYDIYTMVDRKPSLVINGTSRNRYYALNYGGVSNEFSSGAMENGYNVYNIEPGTAELFHQYTLKYDAYTDEKNPWFVSYDEGGDDFEPMNEEDYLSRLEMLTKDYLTLNYKPLSDFTPIDISKMLY